MCSLESLKIDLKGMETDELVRRYDLDDRYFEAIDAPEVRRGLLHVSATIRKSPGYFELRLQTQGTLEVACDICLEPMDQPVETDDRLVVKYGDGNREEDDIVTVDEGEGILDLSWLIYEQVALAIPIRHVHAPGKCDAAMLETLKGLSSHRDNGDAAAQETDPRWEALRKLKMDN